MRNPTAAGFIFALIGFLAGCGSQAGPQNESSSTPLPEYAIGKLGGDEFLLHPNVINLVEYSPDGKLIATVGSSFFGSLPVGFQIWDIASGTEVGPKALRSTDAVALKWSPRGTQYVISRLDEEQEWVVEIWNVATNERVKRLSVTDHACWSVDWSADDQRITAGEAGGRAYVWDAKSGQQIMQFDGPAERVALATDGSYLVVGNERGVFRVAEGENKKCLDIPVKRTNDIEVSPRGDQVAVATDRGVALYDESGRYLACLEPFRSVKVWDVDDAQFVETQFAQLNPEPEFSADISPDGTTIATADQRLRFVRLKDGQRLHDFGAHSATVRSLDVTPDGRYAISVGSSEDVRIWDLNTLQLVQRITVPGEICDAYYLPETKSLGIRTAASGMIWQVRFPGGQPIEQQTSGAEALEEGDYRRTEAPVAFNKAKTTLFYPDGRGDVHLWNIAGTEESGTIPREVKNLMLDGRGEWIPPRLQVSPDGRWLARCFWKPLTIELVNLETRSVERVFREGLHQELTLPCTFSNDGNLLFAPGDDCVMALDVDSGRIVKQFEQPNLIFGIAVSPDGRWVAISESGDWNREKEEYEGRTVRIVSYETGESVADLIHDKAVITTMCFTPDSSKFLTGSPRSTIIVWDIAAATGNKASRQ